MSIDPDLVTLKCDLDEVESSLRRGHLKSKEEEIREDITNPFYDIEIEKLEKEAT